MSGSWRAGIFCLLVWISTGCFVTRTAQADPGSRLPSGFVQRTHEDSAGRWRYLVYQPPDYDPSRRWPVMLYLHGAGERGRDGWMPISTGPAVAFEQTPAPFLAVFPQCDDEDGRARGGWLAGTTAADRALRILAEVEREYSVDPQRRVLVGWSMGAYGAWSLAAADPEHWSAVLAISGGELRPGLSLQKLANARTPVWAIHGCEDELVPCEESRELIARLNQQGGNGSLSVLEDAGHDVWRQVFASPETFHWLLHPTGPTPDDAQLAKVKPLPAHSRFYYQELAHTQRVPDAMSLRLGNRALASLGAELPDLISPDSLSGELDDIERTIENGDDPIQVLLQQVSYHCRVTDCSLKAISGGRLRVRFGLNPLVLTIGRTLLDSRAHQARTGPISVEIGNHRPVRMELEVQPVMHRGTFQLRLLRRNLQLNRGNWYVRPPDSVELHSEQFTERHVVSGIVGTLYQSREELIAQVDSVIPGLLQQVERELQRREAPRLARLLSPLPVLIPELSVNVSHVRTDVTGISLLFNLDVVTRSAATQGEQVTDRIARLGDSGPDATGPDVTVQLLLPAFSTISRWGVEGGQARINLLDIEDPAFQRLTDPSVLGEILPRLIETDRPPRLRVLLRLLAPLEIVDQSEQASAAEAEESLAITTQRAALDVWEETPNGPRPRVRLPFSLSQPLVLTPAGLSETAGAALEVRWLERCQVRFLGAEPLAESPPEPVDGAALERLVQESWTSWLGSSGTRSVSSENARVGNAQFLLERADVQQKSLVLTFRLQRFDGSQQTGRQR